MDASSDLRIEVGGSDTALSELIERGLDEGIRSATGVGDETSFSVRLATRADEVAGGLTGWIWGDTSGISTIWIHDDWRGQGWGRRLLETAERTVAERGCRRIYVSKFSFQAPDFYRANGFAEIARVPGLIADGVEDIWFVKALDHSRTTE